MKRTKKYKRLNRKNSRKQHGGLRVLMRAVENGNLEEVKTIIRRLNASYNNDKESVARAINKKERVDNGRGGYDITPMILAITHNNIEIAILLLANGGTIKEEDYIDLLIIAIREGNKKAVIDIIDKFKKKFSSKTIKRLINENYEGNLTPLQEVMFSIMEYGITKHNAKTISDIILILIENGAIIKKELPWSRVPEEDLQEIIFDNNRRISQIWQIAIIAENIDLVGLLIERDYGVSENMLIYALDSYEDDNENVVAKEIIRLIADKLIKKGIIPKGSGEKTSWREFLSTGSMRKPLEASEQKLLSVPADQVHPFGFDDDANIAFDEDNEHDLIGAFQRQGVRVPMPILPIIGEPVSDEISEHDTGELLHVRQLDNASAIQTARVLEPLSRPRLKGGKRTRRRKRHKKRKN
uniref:Ankyrin repeat protein n=1 Tax=viral metagenome TaxID=1070528 RepID=A0A6C0BAT3_9ZZZZ